MKTKLMKFLGLLLVLLTMVGCGGTNGKEKFTNEVWWSESATTDLIKFEKDGTVKMGDLDEDEGIFYYMIIGKWHTAVAVDDGEEHPYIVVDYNKEYENENGYGYKGFACTFNYSEGENLLGMKGKVLSFDDAYYYFYDENYDSCNFDREYYNVDFGKQMFTSWDFNKIKEVKY